MTDVLPGVNSFIEEELTSTAETKPRPAEKQPEGLTCHFCTEVFEGGARFVKRGLHEKRQHPDEWTAAKATGVKPTKKTAKAKKAATPRKAPAKPASGPVTSAKAKRIPAGDGIAMALGMTAQVVMKVDGPVGRALQFSAPATGDAVDELVAGTFVDRKVIQPFVGVADKWEKVGGIIAFPVLIAVISRNPALYLPLEDQLRAATVDVINAAVPTLEKRKKAEQKAADSIARLGKVDPRYADSDDPIRLILEDIFGVKIVTQADVDGATE
jgi:hypothetical protein